MPSEIGLALGWNERYDHKVAIGIIKYARQRADWRLFGNEWLFRVKRPGHSRTDGIIARIMDRQTLERMLAFGVPVVDIADACEDPRLAQAVNDDTLTGQMAARHLLSRGFQNLAYVGMGESFWSRKRLEGMREAVADGGNPDIPVFAVGESWHKREHSLSGLAKWLKKLPLPCGVAAANDILGYRITVAASMAGLRIPEQLAVIGVDNEDVYCELARPGLTSIACDCERIGMEAANLLRQILDGEDPLRQVVVPPLAVVQRESTNIMIGEDAVIRDVRQFIRSHAPQGINVADVVAAFPLSRRALEKRFEKLAGTTLHREIDAARLDHACRLLRAGSTPAQAGLNSGFSTLQHFYHNFRKRFGTTPAGYAAGYGETEDNGGPRSFKR